MKARQALHQIGEDPDELTFAVALLKRTPVDQLDETVAALKEQCSPESVRKALVERVACTPLADFAAIKLIYLKHCGEKAK